MSLVKKLKKLFGIRTAAAVETKPEDLRALDAQDRARIEFYRQFVAPGELVFDVGANLGNRSKLFLELGARVVAFEPQIHCADLLERAFASHKNFTLLRKALGAAAGEAEMFVANAHTVSTLSSEWVRDTTETGRFEGVHWDGRQRVELTTLDTVIAAQGVPIFIKIDVEGFEYEVLRGLSQPVRGASIEFATESLQNTFLALAHMDKLGTMEFQIALGEELRFIAPQWMTQKQARELLSELCTRDPLAWGDVYMRKAD